MSLLYLPARLSAFFVALAIGLDYRIAQRFPRLLLGVLFARGRRTVTSWFRAAGITRHKAGQQLLWLFDAADRGRRIIVVADGAYAKRPLLLVIRRLRLTLVSRLPSNAALRTLPPRRRRPGQRGPMPTYGKQRIE